MRLVIFIALIFSVAHTVAQEVLSAQKIIDKCIEVHGGSRYNDAHFEYDFRKYHYEYHYQAGQYEYIRSVAGIKDVLTNDGFVRSKDGVSVELDSKKIKSYSNSVNSVHYFAFLPFFLNDPAVHKKLIGSKIINGQEYYKVEVTFEQEGGGDDYDDIYVYWINKESFSLDYLAYSFHVNGGGVRFREAYNRRVINGITFQDYVNYKHDKQTDVREMDQFFLLEELIELSRIELKNIKSL